MRKTGSSNIWIGVICGLFLLLALPSLNQMIIYTPDSARYLAWANSLARFDGFKDATTPEPSRYVVHAPLYSIILAPGAFFFSQSVIAAKVTTLMIGILTIFIFYLWMKSKSDVRTALIGSALLALNPLMLIYSTQILSDVPFAFCFILFLFFAEKISMQENTPAREEYLTLAILTAGVFIRDIGLTLMAGATLFFLLKKQYRRAAFACFVPLLLYLLWFIRNEVIVAAAENPAFRNSRIFLMHLYTSNQESLLTELGIRFWNNLTLYFEMTGRILFFPDFAQRSLSLVTAGDPIAALVFKLMPIGRLFLISATLGLCVFGIWQEIKKNKSLLLIDIILLCYLVPVLFYPINDIRFLFPLLLVMVYFCAGGIKYFDEWWTEKVRFPGARFPLIIAFVLVMIPNIVWLQSYIRSSYQYGKSPEEVYAQIQGKPDYPGQFAKPLHLAGRWIVQHHKSPVVVLSRWKELAFWLDGNKVVDAYPQMSPDTFENLLRDYSVKYITAVVTRVGLNEFEALMSRSRRYTFVPVYRAGDVEVLEVRVRTQMGTGKEQEQTADSTVRSTFRCAMASLEENPIGAMRLLEQIPVRIGGYSEIVLYRGVAMEFSGALDSALVQFEKFRSMPQAGAYLQQARYHLDLILHLKTALTSTNTIQRAELFQMLAVSYWELGYRKRAMTMLSRSLEAEQQFFPALIISALFSFQQGDTTAAWMNLAKARSLQSDNVLTTGLSAIQQCSELLRRTDTRSQQMDLRLKIVESLIAMGLREQAIDDLMVVLTLDPSNRRALLLLGESFEVKQRYEPALRCYNAILLSNSTNREARQKVDNLRARF